MSSILSYFIIKCPHVDDSVTSSLNGFIDDGRYRDISGFNTFGYIGIVYCGADDSNFMPIKS